MSAVKKSRETLINAIDDQKLSVELIKDLEKKREKLQEEINEAELGQKDAFEQKRKSLLESYVDGSLTDEGYIAEKKRIEREVVECVDRDELLAAIVAKQSKENRLYSDNRELLRRLQGEFQGAVIDATLNRLRKKSGVVAAMKELIVMCDLCSLNEPATIEEFIGITDEERVSLGEKFEDRELLTRPIG